MKNTNDQPYLKQKGSDNSTIVKEPGKLCKIQTLIIVQNQE